MAEKTTTPELGGGMTPPLFSKMAGHEEGIYASSTSADVRSQETDQGLTLFPKIPSRDTLCLGSAWAITDDNFEDALKQFPPAKRELHEEPTWSRASSICDEWRLIDSRPAKRRRISRDLPEVPTSQNNAADPLVQIPSVGFPHQIFKDHVKPFMQLSLSAVSPESPKAVAEGCQQNSGKENGTPGIAEPALCLQDRSEKARVQRNDSCNDGKPSHAKVVSIERTDINKRSFIRGHSMPMKGCNISTDGALDCQVAVERDDLQNLSDIRNIKFDADARDVSHGLESMNVADGPWESSSLDSDEPLPSIEKDSQELERSHRTVKKVNKMTSRCMSRMEAASYGVQSGVFRAPTRAAAPLPANDALRNFGPAQNSVKPYAISPQPPSFASVAASLLEQSQQASISGYTKNTASHEVPAVLRERFDALLRKFRTDKDFQRSALTYIMEMSGRAEEEPQEPREDMTQDEIEGSEVEESDLPSTQELAKLSKAQLISRHLAQEKVLAELRKKYKSVRDMNFYNKKVAAGVPRVSPYPGPVGKQPEGVWHCPKVKKGGILCGKVNDSYRKEVVWAKNLRCKCGFQLGDVPSTESSTESADPSALETLLEFNTPCKRPRHEVAHPEHQNLGGPVQPPAITHATDHLRPTSPSQQRGFESVGSQFGVQYQPTNSDVFYQQHLQSSPSHNTVLGFGAPVASVGKRETEPNLFQSPFTSMGGMPGQRFVHNPSFQSANITQGNGFDLTMGTLPQPVTRSHIPGFSAPYANYPFEDIYGINYTPAQSAGLGLAMGSNQQSRIQPDSYNAIHPIMSQPSPYQTPYPLLHHPAAPRLGSSTTMYNNGGLHQSSSPQFGHGESQGFPPMMYNNGGLHPSSSSQFGHGESQGFPSTMYNNGGLHPSYSPQFGRGELQGFTTPPSASAGVRARAGPHIPLRPESTPSFTQLSHAEPSYLTMAQSASTGLRAGQPRPPMPQSAPSLPAGPTPSNGHSSSQVLSPPTTRESCSTQPSPSQSSPTGSAQTRRIEKPSSRTASKKDTVKPKVTPKKAATPAELGNMKKANETLAFLHGGYAKSWQEVPKFPLPNKQIDPIEISSDEEEDDLNHPFRDGEGERFVDTLQESSRAVEEDRMSLEREILAAFESEDNAIGAQTEEVLEDAKIQDDGNVKQNE